MVTPASFATIRQFILSQGDRKTYGNRFNHNPHYDFGTFQVYLNPEGGQRNIDCDPTKSGFDTLVIHQPQADPQYLDVIYDERRQRLRFDPSQRARLEQVFALSLEIAARGTGG